MNTVELFYRHFNFLTKIGKGKKSERPDIIAINLYQKIKDREDKKKLFQEVSFDLLCLLDKLLKKEQVVTQSNFTHLFTHYLFEKVERCFRVSEENLSIFALSSAIFFIKKLNTGQKITVLKKVMEEKEGELMLPIFPLLLDPKNFFSLENYRKSKGKTHNAIKSFLFDWLKHIAKDKSLIANLQAFTDSHLFLKKKNDVQRTMFLTFCLLLNKKELEGIGLLGKIQKENCYVLNEEGFFDYVLSESELYHLSNESNEAISLKLVRGKCCENFVLDVVLGSPDLLRTGVKKFDGIVLDDKDWDFDKRNLLSCFYSVEERLEFIKTFKEKLLETFFEFVIHKGVSYVNFQYLKSNKQLKMEIVEKTVGDFYKELINNVVLGRIVGIISNEELQSAFDLFEAEFKENRSNMIYSSIAQYSFLSYFSDDEILYNIFSIQIANALGYEFYFGENKQRNINFITKNFKFLQKHPELLKRDWNHYLGKSNLEVALLFWSLSPCFHPLIKIKQMKKADFQFLFSHIESFVKKHSVLPPCLTNLEKYALMTYLQKEIIEGNDKKKFLYYRNLYLQSLNVDFNEDYYNDFVEEKA